MKKIMVSVLLFGLSFCGQKNTETVTEPETVIETLNVASNQTFMIQHLVNSETGLGESIGTIFAYEETNGELQLHVKASGMMPGSHGFHLHATNTAHPTTNQSAGSEVVVLGGGLGSHWDPNMTHVHAGPEGQGHKGDLPYLEVSEDGELDQIITVTRFTFSDLFGRSFVIHANPDNYQNVPENGGSGARVYAAVIPNTPL